MPRDPPSRKSSGVNTLKFKRTIDESEEFIPLASTADITFLLIIFFLVTTTFNIEKGINMQLPDTVVQEKIPTVNVSIIVDSSKNLYLDGKEISLKEIGVQTKAILAGHPEKFVTIKSDKNVEYGLVIDILDELFQAGIHNIALPTMKEIIKGNPSEGQ